MIKIVNIDGENFQWIFNGVFRKNETYDNVKSHKKPRLQSLFTR